VRSMLPLPYMKSGWLKIAPPGNPLAPHCDWMRLWFVLDHEALYEMEKVDRKSLAHSYSKQVMLTESSGSSLPARPSMLRIAMEDIVHMAPSADLSLPPGGGFCIETVSGPQNLVCLSLSLSSLSLTFGVFLNDALLTLSSQNYYIFSSEC
jgi:hypothetical protein